MKLSVFIRNNLEAILQEWDMFAHSIQPNLDKNTLRDHAEHLLKYIADDIETLQSKNEQTEKSKGDKPEPLRTSAAEKHGVERFHTGFRITEVIAEYRFMRATIIRLWNKHNPSESLNSYDLIRFNEALDEQIFESVESFHIEHEMQFRQLDTVLSSTSDHNYILDLNGNFSYANKPMLQFLNLPLNELVGKSHFDLTVAAEIHNAVKKVLKTAEKHNGEVEYTFHSGEKRYYEYVCTPVLDDENKIKAVTVAERDITKRKRAEEEKEKLEVQNRLLQKAESLSRMAGAIAHHFNNKLQVVMGHLEMAMDSLPQDEKSVNNLTAAMQAADLAAEVSRSMLTYLGQVTGARAPLDLSAVCRRSLPLIQAALPKNVVFEIDLPSPGPTIIGNSTQIQLILTNLISNSWEAVGDNQGKIQLTVKTVSSADIPPIHRFPINWQADDKPYSCLEIRDSGCGIPDHNIDEAFDPFFSTKFTGRGLGLPVVLGLVQVHSGVVTIESTLDQGSVFRVFFPMTADEVPLQQDKALKTLEIRWSGTVLLVDDDKIVLDITSAMLSVLGFEVLSAMNGVEAVEMFQQHKEQIQFVLTDFAMPHMNGLETLIALRQIDPGIPVILASGFSEEQVMEGTHPELPQVFLSKPYGFKDLKDAIGRTLAENKK
jgi:PAS domain S-box-containing protein